MNTAPDLPAILAAADAFVGDGLVATDELLAHLRAEGLLDTADHEEAIDVLLDAAAIGGVDLGFSADDTLVCRADLRLDGVVLTHVITQEELDDGWLIHDADLVLFDRTFLLDEAVPLADGSGQLDLIDDGDPEDETAAFLDGPDGWLDAFRPGDVITLTYRSNGVEVGRLDDRLGDGEAEAAALRGAFARTEAAGHESFEASSVVFDAVIRHPDAFRQPAPPLRLLLEQVGLEVDGGYLGRAGSGFAGRRFRQLNAEVAQATYGLEACCRTEFAVVQDALDALLAVDGDALDAVEVDPEAVGRALTHSDVARAVVFSLSEGEPDTLDRLLHLLGRLRDAEGAARAGACFTMALLTELSGEVTTAHALVEESIAASPSFLAGREQFARDRALVGDLDAAIRIRQQLDLEGDHELEFLRSLRPVRRSVAGRNDPCPCGSGKKHKACCIGKVGALEPTTHATWLQHKLALFVYRPEHEPLLEELIEAALGEIEDPSSLDDHEQFLVESGVLGNWLAFDGGAATTFLARYGAVLPEIERDMLTDWTSRAAGVYEVIDGRSSGTATLRDLRTGELHQVHDPDAGLATRSGTVVLGHVGRVADAYVLLGVPLTVPESLRDDAPNVLGADPDAHDLAQWYGVMADVANDAIAR